MATVKTTSCAAEKSCEQALASLTLRDAHAEPEYYERAYQHIENVSNAP